MTAGRSATPGPIFKDLVAELKVQTDRLAKVLASDLAAFNAEAKRLGLPEVTGKQKGVYLDLKPEDTSIDEVP